MECLNIKHVKKTFYKDVFHTLSEKIIMLHVQKIAFIQRVTGKNVYQVDLCSSVTCNVFGFTR